MSLRNFVRRHAALTYFVLVIAWLALYWQVLFTLYPLDPERGPTLLHILLVSVGTSPSVFGLLMAYFTAGKDGLRDLLSRLFRWRVGLAWYLAALLLVPGMNAAAYLLYGRLGGQPYGLSLVSLAFALPAGLMTSTLEELGWRGFALPELQKKRTALASGILVGLGWGLWHLPLFYLARAQYGVLALPLLALESLISLTALSVLMTWVHNNSGQSLLLMVLFHLSQTSSNFVFQPPPASSAEVFIRFHLISVAIQWTAVALVVFFAGSRRLALQRRLAPRG